MRLLTRDEFREAVFQRDRHRCVVCGQAAVDAHHIMERRLFPNGGYFLENGASLCSDCHIAAEQTTFSCELIRDKAGIGLVVLPPHLEADQKYDKWGNPILPNGTRMRGELFFDESVQKVLSRGGVLGVFANRVKFPRTFHLPWSPGVKSDDKVLDDLSAFDGRRVVATLKMDGENATVYRDYYHARSLDSKHHPSRDWMKAFAAQFQYEIPEDWRVCGENLYARHSIGYDDLVNYFLMFSVWNDRNIELSWDETVLWSELLGLDTVEVLYDGPWDEGILRKIGDDVVARGHEGFVLRVADAVPYGQFWKHHAKWVRPDHVQTDEHWMHGAVVPNRLRSR